jgi:hypothetical protein
MYNELRDTVNMTWLQTQSLFTPQAWKPKPPASGLTPEEEAQILVRLREEHKEQQKMLQAIVKFQEEKEAEEIANVIVREMCHKALSIPVSKNGKGEYEALLPGGVTIVIGYVDDET